ncbi:hypothetical protein KAF25_006040 [Fusarium avenaceum]|uniref:Uncharacterized protein n=1 Tax=Fusarium avenaceum TaxID=40199 RepID=A0A9P7KLJ1_9HYPO|nr:hypothetical protein KAF25_006040 [Fusarium avenaceum]
MSTSNDTQIGIPSDRPRWLVSIEQTIEEERDELFSDSKFYELVRDLLLAPENDSHAVSQAVSSFYNLYAAGADERTREPPEYFAGHYLNSIACVAFEMASEVPFDTYQHDRLAELLIGIKKGAADEYDTEDPKFVYYGWGLYNEAREKWNACHVDFYTQKRATEPDSVWTGSWIGIAALLAKLFKAGLLEENCPHWFAKDFEDAFKPTAPGDVTIDIGPQAEVLALVNYILIAGEALAEQAKEPQRWRLVLNANKWKLWASKLREVADVVDKNAPWDLKERAQEAYDKMVELYPEAFEDEQQDMGDPVAQHSVSLSFILHPIFLILNISTIMDYQDHEQSSPERPKWFAYISTRIEEEKEEAFPQYDYYEIVRDVLLQSDDSDKVVSQAIEKFYSHYIAGFSEEDFGGRQPPEYQAGNELNGIAVIVFEIVVEIPFTDQKQDLLSRFLIGIAKNAADTFDEKDPKFVCYDWAIQAAAVDRWNACTLNSGPLDYQGPGVTEAINTWISTAALIAKLFQANLLGEYGPLWVSADFKNAFETQMDRDSIELPFKQAKILAAANYILLSGEAFAKEAKDSSKKRSYVLDALKWKVWATALQEIADSVGENTEFDLKHKAQEAHDRMVKLYPEAFEEG